MWKKNTWIYRVMTIQKWMDDLFFSICKFISGFSFKLDKNVKRFKILCDSIHWFLCFAVIFVVSFGKIGIIHNVPKVRDRDVC